MPQQRLSVAKINTIFFFLNGKESENTHTHTHTYKIESLCCTRETNQRHCNDKKKETQRQKNSAD